MMMTIMADDGVRGHEFSYDRGSADRYTLRSITRLRLDYVLLLYVLLVLHSYF